MIPLQYSRVVADFTISDDTICSGQTPPVSFTDLSQSLETGNIVEWEWSFGDGSMSTNQNPTYNFPTLLIERRFSGNFDS
ncbi:MAG: PKD domain-containing protein [Saprospiraceae bacterium]